MNHPINLNGTKWSISVANNDSEQDTLERRFQSDKERISNGILQRQSPGFLQIFNRPLDTAQNINGVPVTTGNRPKPDTNNYVRFTNYELSSLGVTYEFKSNEYIKLENVLNVQSVYFTPLE